MPRTSRGAARRYADLSRRRHTRGVTRVSEETASEPVAAAVTEAPVAADTDGAPVVRHALGETRVTIAPRFRGAAAARPSTFETTDYRYVLADLRRVFVVASILLVALIALSFVIR